MYWPLQLPVKQELSTIGLDFTFMLITCARLHTELKSYLNYTSKYEYLLDFFKFSIS